MFPSWVAYNIDVRKTYRYNQPSGGYGVRAGGRFVSEPIDPVAGTRDASDAARGEPALPGRFRWRGVAYRIAGVVRTWKTTGPCRHGSREIYLRRHWYEIVTDPRAVMSIYCERQARSTRRIGPRWFVYALHESGDAAPVPTAGPAQQEPAGENHG